MNDKTKTIALFAKTALILYLIRFGLSLLIELFPKPVIALLGGHEDAAAAAVRSDALFRFLPLFCSAAVCLVCWYLVQKSVKSNTRESAGFALTVILVVLVLNPVATLFADRFSVLLLAHGAGSDDLAAYSLMKTAEGYVSLISDISYPLLTAAAAMNWYRCRYAGSEAQ